MSSRVIACKKSRQKQLRALLLIASILPSLTACGIPQLRGAQRGAAVPASFKDVTNWKSYGPDQDNTIVPPIKTEPKDSADGSATDDAKTDTDVDAKQNSDQPAKDDPTPDSSPSDVESSRKSSTEKSRNPLTKLVSYFKPKSVGKPKDETLTDANTASTATNAASDPNSLVTPASALLPQADLSPNQVLLSGGGWAADPNSIESSALRTRFEIFQDPTLQGLIEQAIAGNQELKILAEDVQIAFYEVQARSGAYLPFVDYRAGAGLEKSGVLTREGAVESQLNGRPGRAFPDPLPDFMVGSTVSWEIDIWKRLRNAQRAACMRYLATQEGRNYVVTRLVAEVSENYFELLSLDNQMKTLTQTIGIQEKSLDMARRKWERAAESPLAVQRFQAEVQKNRSELLIVKQSIIEVENKINQRLGRFPQTIERPDVDFIGLQFTSLSAGMPPELLRNRADIRQAEREIAAAGLDVQVAKARFYPSVGISAGVGYRAFDARYLFSTPDSLIYNVAGDLVGPLINKRAIQAEYKTANARQLQSIYDYQQTVIDAFTEVVNYMAKVENYGQSIEVKRQQLASLETSVDFASKLFQRANADYIDVLLAQRDYMEARMKTIETKQEQMAAMVNAYRALGGGCF